MIIIDNRRENGEGGTRIQNNETAVRSAQNLFFKIKRLQCN